ncbi:RNA-binding region-containing protein 3 isoform X1 [Engystomops pustulosus]|uniref:RNA-binding region-containing protein 3 isoform X1 n=1 Tax=Engystomops pustulosus TaxID=76066 RepID=UPI003AFB2A09
MEPVARKTLLVRHLPSELSAAEQRQLLEKSGAQSVRLCSGRTRGSLKNVAFATYPNEYAAAKALSVLHQLKVLSHTLVVEYAKEDDVHLPDQPGYSEKKKSSGEKADERKDAKLPEQVSIERGIAPNHGLLFPIRSSLKYLYPPPTSTVLANIANALASVPKFYVQVLHLMNKMNLPAPFGPLTAQPPLYADYLAMPYPPVPPDLPENPPLPELDDDYDMDVSSREESEYESGDEEEKERAARLKELVDLLPKRSRIKKAPHPRKKMKIKDLIMAPVTQQSNPHVRLSPSEVFEQPSVIGPKKLELHIPADITATDAMTLCLETQVATEAHDEVLGFGKIYPVTEPKDKVESDEDDDDLPKEFISRRELEKGRLSKDEMRNLSVFKNYEPGEPNCRLYVKNLSKQVTEKDLKFIFGKFIDFSSDTEKNMFDIRLMTEGRMKGQAFIGLPNEAVAAKALKHTHGYVLFDKPMVIQFARSARPKPNADKTHTKR